MGKRGINPFVNSLREATIPIRSDCGSWSSSLITNNMICAGSLDNSNPAGSCQGDSGGPLFISDGGWVQVGIVSWGCLMLTVEAQTIPEYIPNYPSILIGSEPRELRGNLWKSQRYNGRLMEAKCR